MIPADLQVRQLVLADRHQVGPAGQDVGRLMHRVGEHQAGHRRRAGRRHLVLDGRIPADLGDADQAQERQQKLVKRLDLAVREDGGPIRVDADGQVVGYQSEDDRRRKSVVATRSVMAW